MRERKEANTSDGWRINAGKRRTRSLIETSWAQIISLYDDKPVAVHMVNILRSRGAIAGYREESSIIKDALGNEKIAKIKVPIYKDPYYMSDEEVLKIMESYREELDVDALDSAQTNED